MVNLKTADAARTGLATFFRISQHWRLDVATQMAVLGIRSRTTYYAWRKLPNKPLRPDTLERLSYVFGIYKALQILFPRSSASNQWIHKPNSAKLFGGKAALDLLRGGLDSDLAAIRKYLDANLS
jgi:hypothetical protein